MFWCERKKIRCLIWFLVSASRIWIWFLKFWFAGPGSDRKWTGSATLLITRSNWKIRQTINFDTIMITVLYSNLFYSLKKGLFGPELRNCSSRPLQGTVEAFHPNPGRNQIYRYGRYIRVRIRNKNHQQERLSMRRVMKGEEAVASSTVWPGAAAWRLSMRESRWSPGARPRRPPARSPCTAGRADCSAGTAGAGAPSMPLNR